MKIMYCIRGLHNSGGMERVLSVKANLLAARGHEVTIVVLRLKGRKPFFPIDPSVRILDLSDPSALSSFRAMSGCGFGPGYGYGPGPNSCSCSGSSSGSCSSSGSGSFFSSGSCSFLGSVGSDPTLQTGPDGSPAVPSSGSDAAYHLEKNAPERLKGGLRDRLSSVIRVLDPDVCVSLCGPEVRVLPSAAGGRPCVAEYHFSHDKFFRKYSGIFLYPYAWLRTRRLERALAGYDCMVTLTEQDLPTWKRYCPRVERIFNPVTTPAGPVSPLVAKKVIAVGRLEEQKNFKDLVAAWAIVARKHPDWRLEIFGEGKLEKSLRAQIDRLGLSGSVTLRGVVKDIGHEYSKASALVMTSLHEGFPLALVEASSFGLPLISYDCPTGPSEIIHDARHRSGDGISGRACDGISGRAGDGAGSSAANGFLVPTGDVAALADRICLIAADDQLRHRLGAASMKSSQRFAPEVVIDAWESLFSSLIDSKS